MLAWSTPRLNAPEAPYPRSIILTHGTVELLLTGPAGDRTVTLDRWEDDWNEEAYGMPEEYFDAATQTVEYLYDVEANGHDSEGWSGLVSTAILNAWAKWMAYPSRREIYEDAS